MSSCRHNALCPDTVREVVGMNDLIETLIISNQPIHPDDRFVHVSSYNDDVHMILLSRNVLRDPINYIRLTVRQGHIIVGENNVITHCIHKNSTQIIRSKELLRELVSVKLLDVYDNKSDDYVFWSYTQDGNEGMHVKDYLYETDEEELETAENDHTETILNIADKMMEHTCEHSNQPTKVDNDITTALMNLNM